MGLYQELHINKKYKNFVEFILNKGYLKIHTKSNFDRKQVYD